MSYKDSQKTSATIQVLVKVFPGWHHISAAKHRIFKLSLSVRLPLPARAGMPSVYLQLGKFKMQVLEQFSIECRHQFALVCCGIAAL